MSAPDLPPVPEPDWGAVDADLAAEFPELSLRTLTVAARDGRSPPELRDRLGELSNRFRGRQAIVLRQRPIPWAYRVFFRHVGLDPDVHRTPVEAMAVDRLLAGGFTSRGLLADACTIAVVETGVGVWALDAARVRGGLQVRAAREGERLGRAAGAPPATPGRLVVADDEGPVAVLFGDVAATHAATAASERVTLFAVGVDGVPMIYVEEALGVCAETLAEA